MLTEQTTELAALARTATLKAAETLKSGSPKTQAEGS
jgi:hypothetical protein